MQRKKKTPKSASKERTRRGLFHAVEGREFGRSICFLCGGRLNKTNRTEEHVIPRWVQRRFSLYNQQIILLNGTKIAYRSLTIPCCDECNKKHLKPIEDSVAEATLQGPKAVAVLDPLTLFVWLGKIFYGLLYKELFLRRDRTSGRRATIATRETLRAYALHQLFLQAVRLPMKFIPAIPASIFIFELEAVGDKRLQWDFRDSLNHLTVSCRMGNVGILAALQDGGAQRDSHVIPWEEFQKHSLHPIHFTELSAAFFYAAGLLNRTPKFMIFDGEPTQVGQNPLQGFSSKPIFDDWNQETFATILSKMLGLPLEQVFQAPSGVATWLHDETGAIHPRKLNGFESGRFG